MQYTLGLKENETELNLFMPVRASTRDFVQAEQVGLHYHHAMEINLFSDARGTARIGGQAFDLASCPVLVTPPDMPHGYDILEGGSVRVFHISFAGVRQIFGAEYRESLNLSDLSWLEAVPFRHERYPALEEPLSRIIGELSAGSGNGGRLERAVGLISPVVAVLDILAGAGRQAGTVPGDHMRRVIEFSEAHWREPIQLSAVAAAACFSVPHFCRVFKAAAGVSYVDYLSRLRIEKACAMLRSGLPVTDACFDAGFRNLSYFIQVFKRHTGTTPGRFLREG